MNLARLQLGLVAALAATCVVSIFATQLLLALAVLVFAARLLRRETALRRTPLDGPILAFCVWTLLAAAFSPQPLASHFEAKKLVLFALFYLALDTFQVAEARERVMDAALLGGVALCGGALLQYLFLGYDSLANRPSSFLGHYMTASGLVMAVLVVAAARLAFRRAPPAAPSPRDLRALVVVGGALVVLAAAQAADLFALEATRLFVAGVAGAGASLALARSAWPGRVSGDVLAMTLLPLAGLALLLSRTRNAWLGALAGLVVIGVLRAPKALWVLGAGLLVLLAVRPAPVLERLTVTDASSRDRYYMWQAGIDMIRDKPVFGQGPGLILDVYPQYRWPDAPNPQAPHLHFNALQIAAERGLPCLALWIWWVAAAMGDAYREVRRREWPFVWGAAAAFAFLCAFMVAGLFEYNFGDSEILMFGLIITAIPYALRANRPAAAAA